MSMPISMKEMLKNKSMYNDYKQRYQLIVENQYPKLSKRQKKAMMYILIADSLTADQMKNDPVYSLFSYGWAQKLDDNTILVNAHSLIIRALERKGLIKFIKEGKFDTGRIQLTKNYEAIYDHIKILNFL